MYLPLGFVQLIGMTICLVREADWTEQAAVV